MQFPRFVPLLGIALSLLIGGTAAAHAGEFTPTEQDSNQCLDYFPQYEQKFGIPANLLRAISINESGRWNNSQRRALPWPWTINAEGKGYYFKTKSEAIAKVRALQRSGVASIDIGCMQVNLYYHPDAFRDLNQAFDPKYNIAYAAYFLRQHYEGKRSWDRAVANYHSMDVNRNTPYLSRVRTIWHKERALASATTTSYTPKPVASVTSSPRPARTLSDRRRQAPLIITIPGAQTAEVSTTPASGQPEVAQTTSRTSQTLILPPDHEHQGILVID